jgi:hypothetical protein
MQRCLSIRQLVGTAGIFVACLFAVFAGPVVGLYGHSLMPNDLSNFLFFGPQLLFPYESLVVPSPQGSRPVFSHGTGLTLTLLHWAVITLVFAAVARRLSPRYRIVAAAATILVVGIGMQVAFSLFGVSVELDGP